MRTKRKPNKEKKARQTTIQIRKQRGLTRTRNGNQSLTQFINKITINFDESIIHKQVQIPQKWKAPHF